MSRNRKKLLSYGLSVLLLGAVILLQNSHTPKSNSQATPIQSGGQKIVKVDDGDTVQISDGLKKLTIRLIGVDTPEVVDPRKPVQCFGKEASAFTKSQLPIGTPVTLEVDPTQGELDKYGRSLGYIILADGTNYNKRLIEQGYAHEYTYQGNPYKYQKDFKAAEIAARNAGLGLWNANTCAGDTKKAAK